MSSPPVVIQATLGGILGASVLINIILLTVVVVLLTKTKDTNFQSVQPSPNRNKYNDIEMKTNSDCDDILTKPNEVYGVTTATETNDIVYTNVASM